MIAKRTAGAGPDGGGHSAVERYVSGVRAPGTDVAGRSTDYVFSSAAAKDTAKRAHQMLTEV